MTILSLDAPLVALVWQDFFARVFAVEISPAHRLLLGMSVWLGYMADRWLDGRKLAPGAAVTTRHRFAQQFSLPIAVGWVSVFLGTLVLAIAALNRGEFLSGVCLAVAVFAYLGACHRQGWLRRFGWLKEIAVAVLVSGGAAIFVFTRCPVLQAAHWIALLILIALCLLNCVVVSVWERSVDTRQCQPSLALRFGLQIERVFKLGIALLGAAIIASLAASWFVVSRTAMAASVTIVGSLALIRWGTTIELETRHLLIDVTLLSPLVLIPFL